MTVESPPGVLNDVGTDGKIQRHTTQALAGHTVGAFAGGVSAFGTAHGICYPAALAVSQQASPGMGVTVAAGTALITGTVSAEQGPYSFYNDAAVDLSIAAAHASLTRWDLVIAQIQDDTYSGASNTPRVTVVTGTASGSPADPSLAAFPNALVLARVVVAGGVTSIVNANVTDLRTPARASAWYQAWGKSTPVASKTGDQAGITAEVDISSLSATWTAVAGRSYKVTAYIRLQQLTNAATVTVRITDASNNAVAGGSATLAVNGIATMTIPTVVSPSAGSVTYKVRASSALSSLTVLGSSTSPCTLLVEDDGPA